MQVPVSVFEAALFIVNIWCVDFFSSFRPGLEKIRKIQKHRSCLYFVKIGNIDDRTVTTRKHRHEDRKPFQNIVDFKKQLAFQNCSRFKFCSIEILIIFQPRLRRILLAEEFLDKAEILARVLIFLARERIQTCCDQKSDIQGQKRGLQNVTFNGQS